MLVNALAIAAAIAAFALWSGKVSLPIRELVVIDGNVSNSSQIASALEGNSNRTVIVLPPGEDSLADLTEAVRRYSGVQSLHIISHGEEGRLQLGGRDHDAVSVGADIAIWRDLAKSLKPDADILLYGCNIARGDQGRALLKAVATATGKSVAASNDQTGASALGGNWRLEQHEGEVEVASLAAPDWHGVLAQNNTGTWMLGANTASNTITVGPASTTATFTFGSFSTGTTSVGLTNETLNNIAVFTPAVQNTASLGIQYNWDTTPEGAGTAATNDGGTAVMTITFSAPVTNPILHLDRIGGSDGARQNSMILTLQTGGVTLTRLNGTGHFAVTATTITNSQNGVNLGFGYTSESNTTINRGTAAGSVRLNGTFSSVSFLLAPAAGTTEGAGGDLIEGKLTYDPAPVAQADNFTGYVNNNATGNLYADNGAGVDSDFNNDTLTITQINNGAYTVGTPIALSGGQLTINNATTGAFTFAPTAGVSGTTTFNYTISDANGGTSTATVTIVIQRTTVQITKTSLGAVGGFTFTGNNGWASQTITTVTSGTGVTGAVQTLTAPSTATTITETIPVGYVVSAISCTGLGTGTATPNLGAGSVTLNAAATAAGNAVQCSFTNTRRPTLQLTKNSLGGVGSFNFTGTNGFSNQTINTAVAGTPVSGAVQTLTAASTTTTITETIPANYTLASVSCTGIGSGTATPNLAAGTVTLDALATAPGNVIQCTFTNARRPTLQLSKTSLGGVGGFAFTGTNGWANQTITTATSGTAVNGAVQTLTSASTATTITETIPVGYAVTAISCTGIGTGTATPNLAAGSITLDALATAPGNVIQCAFTNTRLPTLQLNKTSIGAVGGFTFTGNNGWASQTITTATSGTAVNGAVQTLAAASTATTITETIPVGYAVTAVNCTGLGAGTATPNLAAGSVLLNAAATAPGNAVQCSFTNTRLPSVQLSKTSIGAVGGFTFTGTNGWASQTITTATSGTPVIGAVQFLTSPSTATTITETIPPGYVVTAINCTGIGGGTATPNLATGAVVLNAAATAPGNTVQCSFTNTRLPTIQLRKISNGAVGAFSFSGTNGFGTDTITTTVSGSPVNGVVKTLTAVSTATTITETIPATYFLSSIGCTGLGSGTATPNLITGTISLDAAAMAAGNVVVCTYTNTLENPSLSVAKSSNTSGPVVAGNVITYTYTITNNGNRPLSGVQVSETFNGTGSSPVPANETLLTDNAPLGDSSDSTANNGTWSTLGPGDVIRFTATYTVTQSDVDTLQ